MTVKSRYFPFGLNSEKFHVFCFHHAGGSALTYRAWAVRDFDNVEFVPVETPGFGTLSDINIPGSVDEAAQSIAAEIIRITPNENFALYGHSLGAAMAFKTAYILEHNYGSKPKLLIVAGRHAPHIEIQEGYNSSMDDSKLKDELVRMSGTPKEILEDNEFLQYILPKIKASYKLAESFTYSGEKLSVPIVAHCGTDDYGADFDKMLEWCKVTEADGFLLKEYRGGHFFMHSIEDKYPADLANIVI